MGNTLFHPDMEMTHNYCFYSSYQLPIKKYIFALFKQRKYTLSNKCNKD